MAQRTVYMDDMDGSEGADPVRFGLDGMHFVIDLGATNSKALRDFLAPYIAKAQEDKPAPAQAGKKKRKDGEPGAYGYDPQKARAYWQSVAGQDGIPEFNKRGRVPAVVIKRAEQDGVPLV